MRNLIYIDDVVSAVHSLISSPENFKETYLLSKYLASCIKYSYVLTILCML